MRPSTSASASIRWNALPWAPANLAESLQLHERVIEMVSVRVENGGDNLAVDLVEDDEVGVHGSPIGRVVVTVGDTLAFRPSGDSSRVRCRDVLHVVAALPIAFVGIDLVLDDQVQSRRTDDDIHPPLGHGHFPADAGLIQSCVIERFAWKRPEQGRQEPSTETVLRARIQKPPDHSGVGQLVAMLADDAQEISPPVRPQSCSAKRRFVGADRADGCFPCSHIQCVRVLDGTPLPHEIGVRREPLLDVRSRGAGHLRRG